MSNIINKSSVLGSYIYITDMGLEGCIYILQIDPIPDVNGADVSRATGVL